MSRIAPVIIPVFNLTILLLSTAAAHAAASSPFTEAVLRRLPISFDRPAAHVPDAHRLALFKTHRRSHEVAQTLNKSELLARAANLLTVSGYTDIKSIQTEGDHVAALVMQNDQAQHLIVTKEGAVAAGDTAAIKPEAVTSAASSPPPTVSATSVPSASVAGADADTTKPQVQAATVGSISEAASPGALSASSSTP